MKFSDLKKLGLPLIRVKPQNFSEDFILHEGTLNEYLEAAKNLQADGLFYWGFSAKELFNGVLSANSDPSNLSDLEITRWLTEVSTWVQDDIGKELIGEIININSPLTSLENITRFQVLFLYQGKYFITEIYEASWVQIFHDNFSSIKDNV